MKMTHITLTTLAFLTFAERATRADVHRRHGSLCAPKHTSVAVVGADERGVYNASTTAPARVTCPVVDRTQYKEAYVDTGGESIGSSFSHGSPSITTVNVYGRDLSRTTPFSCYLFWTEDLGYSSWAPRKYACSAGGGCPDSTSEYTGMVSMSWTIDPVEIQIEETNLVGVVCDLPPTTSLGNSYVKSIRTVDTRHFVVAIYHYWLEGERYLDEYISQFRNH